jgi:hypothetical protein
MLTSCVNPACRNEFRFLNTGNLYAFERRSGNTEFFWLCSTCAPLVAHSLDPMGCISVRPQSETVRLKPPHPDGYLRLVAQRKPRTQWRRASLDRGLTPSIGYERDSRTSSSGTA